MRLRRRFLLVPGGGHLLSLSLRQRGLLDRQRHGRLGHPLLVVDGSGAVIFPVSSPVLFFVVVVAPE